MENIILLRGPSGVGKSAIAKELILYIKKELKLDCAYVSEDNFRKKMQFKYKAEDKIAHLQSVPIIKAVINELNKIDKYDFIIIEGLFRYEEMIEEYKKFCKNSKFKLHIFQLSAPIEVRRERGTR
jgi:uridine kinase